MTVTLAQRPFKPCVCCSHTIAFLGSKRSRNQKVRNSGIDAVAFFYITLGDLVFLQLNFHHQLLKFQRCVPLKLWPVNRKAILPRPFENVVEIREQCASRFVKE